ncbi:TPA: hypothetical protein ACTW8S_005128 [Klebsiella variicola subsp. variicola]
MKWIHSIYSQKRKMFFIHVFQGDIETHQDSYFSVFIIKRPSGTYGVLIKKVFEDTSEFCESKEKMSTSSQFLTEFTP